MMRRRSPAFERAKRRARARRERGAALLAVLVVVTILSAVSIALVDDIRLALRRTAATQLRDQAHWYALGAQTFMEEVIARSWQLDNARSTAQSPWMQEEATFPIEGGLLQGRIRDGSNCFNLNSVVSQGGAPRASAVEEYIRLLSLLDIGTGSENELAYALVDWIDPDASRSRRGAEDVAYSVLTPPYRPANARLSDELELRSVLGYTEEVFQALRPFICAQPDDAPSVLNINTLTEEQAVLLQAVFGDDFSQADALSLIEGRPQDGYQSMAEVKADPALQAYMTQNEDRPEMIDARLDVQTRYFDAHARVIHYEAYVEINVQLELNKSTGDVWVVRRRLGERNG